jgi:aspartyl-tRNA(Asn)/glutamyl-tRNA(Gln) amidotransferase subunit C
LLTPEEVRHVAMLARLGLSDDEVATMQAQLSQVLDHISMLEKLDTSAIAPTAQVLSHLNIMRPDEARPSLSVEAALSNAPVGEDGFFRVPAVLEELQEAPAGREGEEGGDV